MYFPLAYLEDGTAFQVPRTQDPDGPARWLVHRKPKEDGGEVKRGRPPANRRTTACTRNGQPITIPLETTHDELFHIVGPGKYRLQVVNRYGEKIDDVPFAHTGDLGESISAESGHDDGEFEYDAEDIDTSAPMVMPSYAGRRRGMESLLVHAFTSNTKTVQQLVDLFVPVMETCRRITETVSGTGVAERLPLPEPIPQESTAPSDASLSNLINQLVPVVSMIASRFAPMRSSSSATAASAAPSTNWPPGQTDATAAEPWMEAGAAPSNDAGAAPGDGAVVARADTRADMQTRAVARLREVLAGLNADERQLALQMVSGLPEPVRETMLAELLRISVPEAIARARALLTMHGPAAPAPTRP